MIKLLYMQTFTYSIIITLKIVKLCLKLAILLDVHIFLFVLFSKNVVILKSSRKTEVSFYQQPADVP